MKIMRLVALLLIAAMGLFGGTITKDYSFDKGSLKESRSPLFNDMCILSMKGLKGSGKIGEPGVPYHPISLLLPAGEEVVDLKVVRSGKIKVDGDFNLSPIQPSKPISIDDHSAPVINRSTYLKDISYPENPLSHYSTEFLNGHSIVLSTFTPFEYHPKSGELYLYTEVEVLAETKVSDKGSTALSNLRGGNEIRNRVVNLVQNGELLKSYPTPKEWGDKYQIALISDSEFDFSALTQFYLDRGLEIRFTDVDDIYTNFSGVDNPEKIRNFIIDQYQNNGVSHIILGGDVEIVPPRGFFCEVQSSSVYSDDSIPSDLYYSALDGNWNSDNDNLWGEIDEDDLLPDISVGRMPFSTQTELNNMINKTITYQTSPIVEEIEKPLLVGEHMWDNPLTWGADYMELLIGFHDDNGYETTGIYENYDIQKLYDKDATWGPSQLMDKINEGTILLNHCGHSNYDYTMKFTNYDITSSNFSGANGVDHSFPVLYSHGCICGAFDYSDCIGENMVTLDNFASAFICNSRYGWFNEGQTEGPSQHINREFINSVYGNGNTRIGTSHLISKIETSPWVNAPNQHEEGALRWCFYCSNLLGDPMQAMWSKTPVTPMITYDETVYIVDGSTEVVVKDSDGNLLPFVDCAIVANDHVVGYGVTDSEGVAEIIFNNNIEPGDGQLTISGNNIPLTTFSVEMEGSSVNENIIDGLNLLSNYPNPFNPSTTISFNIEKSSDVSLMVFNIAGEQVAELVKGEVGSGYHRVQFDGSNLNSGVYFYKLSVNGVSKTEKMVLCK